MSHRNRLHRPARLAALTCAALLLVPMASACSSDGDKADGASSTTAPAGAGKGDGAPTTTADGGPTTTAGEVGPTLEPTAAEQPYVDAIVKASTAEGNTDLPLAQDQAEVRGAALVRTLGVARFTDAGISADEVTVGAEEVDGYFKVMNEIGDAKTAKAIVGAFDECAIDLRAVLAEIIGSGGLTAEQKSCLADEIPLAPIQKGLASTLDGDEKTVANLEDPIGAAMDACQG